MHEGRIKQDLCEAYLKKKMLLQPIVACFLMLVDQIKQDLCEAYSDGVYRGRKLFFLIRIYYRSFVSVNN